jgi:uncharacterized protein (TIGR02246 family)
MPVATDSRTVVARYVEAVEAGDEQTILDSFAEDATWTLAGDLPVSGVWRGRDAIMNDFLAKALGFYQPGSISLEVTSLIADGQDVAVEWTSRARNLRGEPYENFCVGVFTVVDGKIASVREYMDTLYAARRAFGAAQAA